MFRFPLTQAGRLPYRKRHSGQRLTAVSECPGRFEGGEETYSRISRRFSRRKAQNKQFGITRLEGELTVIAMPVVGMLHRAAVVHGQKVPERTTFLLSAVFLEVMEKYRKPHELIQIRTRKEENTCEEAHEPGLSAARNRPEHDQQM